MSTNDFQAKQFTLSDDGQIFYQADATNPTPGVAVATLVKGADIFAPTFNVIDGASLSAEQVEQGLQLSLGETLSVFKKLTQDNDTQPEAVQSICQAVYDAAGMCPREDLQAYLSVLDTDMRAALRAKGIRLGPLFIYCPEMNKPAALRVRAVLYGVFHGLDLPVTRVPDGMVSKRVESEGETLTEAQKNQYKALCYPVYGGRAIRIDMLDRVVNAIYDSADKGKFQAQHSMAEWMGCPIAELYQILEALGHKKVYDPADEVKAEEEAKATTSAATEVEGASVDAPTAQAEDKPVEADAETTAETPAAPSNVKPELATFALKRGKAYESGNAGRSNRKPFKKSDKDGGKKDFKKSKKPKGNKNGKDNRGPRVISAESKSTSDSPFAVLGQLKNNVCHKCSWRLRQDFYEINLSSRN